ncbi:hypothetical protein HB772_09055 [Sinorhizobium meliloti]|nr:hypothetical protein HB772_09055 [Sinorhizobium meliloti]
MALSPELKRMVSGATLDPLEAKRAEILAQQADNDDESEDYHPTIRELAWLGLQKATKQELREIIVKSMERDPDA